ncbi:type VI secretion system-associated FHA domain protein [Sphingomonas immobilis]|uniref:FHA domain-containing protein n=1 Tax=Sphingomonas immobilis TaxID=3063997 RepID=A0ABT8ZZG1_9SPHN|nr:type VI secretion system-associated FHA domain protein [Sphingomonas sp. CA1-15]MDO7842509.1 FHA domain-containing protein [Sphingomonas sp. CA1-15]
MYMLQLFNVANELQPIDARLLREGMLTIGRGEAADWTIADPERELSRQHCELVVGEDGTLHVRSLGANGIYDDTTGERFPDSTDVTVPVPSTVRLGRFRLKAVKAGQSEEPADPARTMVMTQPFGESVRVPETWSDTLTLSASNNGSLLDAFCEGAGLDPSLLSSEDPAEIMRRAGAVYRQMVLGIGDLMTERDRARAKHQINRTTIAGADNNPFKWAPTQRLAIDLLLAGSGSFLSGPAALQASLRDIKRHMIATFAGLQGSLRAAVAHFDPKVIETVTADRTTLLKGKAVVQIEEVSRRHADITAQLDGDQGGSLERAFLTAYDSAESQSYNERR